MTDLNQLATDFINYRVLADQQEFIARKATADAVNSAHALKAVAREHAHPAADAHKAKVAHATAHTAHRNAEASAARLRTTSIKYRQRADDLHRELFAALIGRKSFVTADRHIIAVTDSEMAVFDPHGKRLF